eukprot:1323474-Prymnesium_polylepis.1
MHQRRGHDPDACVLVVDGAAQGCGVRGDLCIGYSMSGKFAFCVGRGLSRSPVVRRAGKR